MTDFRKKLVQSALAEDLGSGDLTEIFLQDFSSLKNNKKVQKINSKNSL